MHRNAKVKTRTITSDTHAISMKNANDSFDNYLACLQNGIIIEKEQALQLYVRNRKKVTREIMLSEHKRWDERTSDFGKLWGNIDWKGRVQHASNIYPTINQLKNHFEDIYETSKYIDTLKIIKISSDVYIPILDDPITESEVKDSLKKCKKGGYDFTLPVLNYIVTNFMPTIIILFNVMFYMCYPVKLACS